MTDCSLQENEHVMCVCECVYVCACVSVCECMHMFMWGRPHMKKPVHHLSNVFFSMYVIYETIEEICVCGSQIVG